MVLISSIGFVLASDTAPSATARAPVSVFTHIWGGRGMPHIGEPGAKLRRLCALFRELFYMGELSAGALLNHISPSAWCRTNPYAQLKRDLHPDHFRAFWLLKICHIMVGSHTFWHFCNLLFHFEAFICIRLKYIQAVFCHAFACVVVFFSPISPFALHFVNNIEMYLTGFDSGGYFLGVCVQIEKSFQLNLGVFWFWWRRVS